MLLMVRRVLRAPLQVALLTKLTRLTLSGNPLLFPPRSMVAGKRVCLCESLCMQAVSLTSAVCM